MKKNKILKKKKKLGFFASLGLITDKIARFFKRGFIGFFFADLYTQCNKKWKGGYIYNILRKRKRRMRKRATFSHIYEKSLLSKRLAGYSQVIIHSPLRIFGVEILFFAFAVIGTAMLKYYLEGRESFESLIVASVLALFSLPLIISRKELGEALLKGRLTKFIVVKVLNQNPTRFERGSSSNEGNYLSAILFSMALGFISYFFHPLLIIAVILLGVLFILTMAFPELGIVFLIIALPFSGAFPYPSVILLTLLIFTTCGFIFKLSRGKRVARLELIDVFVLAFSILLLFSGVFTFGDRSSLYSAELYFAFLAVYFLIVNMYIGKSSIYRAFKILIVTCTIVSVVGIVRGGVINSSWVDIERFGDMPGRVSVFLGNPNMLGVYLVLAFPFALAMMKVSKKKLSKFAYLVSAALIVTCIIMTGSRGAWLGLIASVIIFFLVYNFRNIWIFLGLGCLFPLLQYVVPTYMVDRFMSIFNMQDSSIQMRISIWKGVWEMVKDNFLTGIGIGDQAFKFVYDGYALDGAQSAAHAHSLLLQIILNVGIVGLIIFLCIMFMYGQKCFVEIKEAHIKSRSRTLIIAGLSSISGGMIMGITDNIWYNYRIFFMFWIIIALVVSLARNNVKERNSMKITNNITSADLEINC